MTSPQRLCLLFLVLRRSAGAWGPEDALSQHRDALSQQRRGSLRGAASGAAVSGAVAAPPRSRDARVRVSCDVRGNLGPCDVVVQDPPGTDWLRDRWQAASDMGGTAIPGAHWIELDMGGRVAARRVVIDWETAHADEYRLEVKGERGGGGGGGGDDAWRVVFDGGSDADRARRRVATSGRSPGVRDRAVPLHYVHTIDLPARPAVAAAAAADFRYLRLYIVRPAVGWGVSVWQLDVYAEDLARPAPS